MNCRGCRQRFLPLPDLSRKTEGDYVRRVAEKKIHKRFVNYFNDRLETCNFLEHVIVNIVVTILKYTTRKG